ncbi:Sterol regulatory element-binding protein cleavage-activating protein [Venturia nashicola]|nr:Sterol regulatory element-binding protein cleavage-activating protein [Venturia nashicola]
MIWYLLWPFRGTTEPPRLAPEHPIRRAFYQYGVAAARHWLLFILGSVATAVVLCYPVFFLYNNPTTGSSKLPYHVWTSARLYDGHPNTVPDLEVRQIWVHGSYNKAFEKPVLQEALSIQDTLVGSTHGFEEEAASEDGRTRMEHGNTCQGDIATHHPSLGLHSPLMFWNCSFEALQADTDVVDTINSQVTRKSYLNLTLRPASVFASKSFADGRVIGADALVITVFDRVTETTNRQWDDRLSSLARDAPHRWDLYPRGGHFAQGQLYEFQQKPLSTNDELALLGSYASMLGYVAWNLSGLRAVKSWTGLLITLISQAIKMLISIIASFSICGFLQIDLARVPDYYYPFIVWVIGLENMFRLVNSVLIQPPEQQTIHRVATALAEVSTKFLAATTQMLVLLWIISKKSSELSAFCTFAAIALFFDFFFHLTFFLPVVSVDVRRMELSDSLDRLDLVKNRNSSVAKAIPERQFFLETLLLGRGSLTSRIATSRIAGIVTSICFILGLNVHFFEDGNPIWSFFRSLQSMFHSHPMNGLSANFAPIINQARTPTGWIMLQDYKDAKQILDFVKPNVHHIVARVYDPLFVVLHGSNRAAPSADTSLLEIWWNTVRKHIYPFLLALFFSVAVVTLLMQYMLWNELPDEEIDSHSNHHPSLSLDTLPQAHRLDLIKLAACARGHIISVSLDRLVSFSLFDPHTHKYSFSVLSTVAMMQPLWPIVSIALDENGDWAALCTQDGNIAFWNLPDRRLSHFTRVKLEDQQICAFDFISIDRQEGERPSLIIVTCEAIVFEVDVVGSKVVQSFRTSQEKLVFATISRSKSGVNIIALTRSGRIRIAASNSGDWALYAIERLDSRLAPGSKEGKTRSLTSLPSLDVFATVRLRVVDLVDIKTKTLIHTFQPVLIKGNSLRILSSPRRECKNCHSAAVHSVSLAYVDFETHACVIRTYTLSNDLNKLICLAPTRAGKRPTCPGFPSSKEHTYTVNKPGSWEATRSQAIIGVRLRPRVAEASTSSSSSSSGFEPTYLQAQPHQDVTHRHRSALSPSAPDTLGPEKDVDSDEWEVWTMSSSGEFHTEPLPTSPNELLVADTGPIVPFGNRSVALGFGNKVKVGMVGNERFEKESNGFQGLAHLGGSRRRKMANRRII